MTLTHSSSGLLRLQFQLSIEVAGTSGVEIVMRLLKMPTVTLLQIEVHALGNNDLKDPESVKQA